MTKIATEAIVLLKKGNAQESLARQAISVNLPQKNEVLIESEAFGLNYADVMARRGLYREAPPMPCVVGYEVVGKITHVGEGVNTDLIGKRVLGFCRFGGYGKHVITNDFATVEIGDNTTIREFVTINRGTTDRWKTKVGNNCLIMAYSHVAHDCVIGDNCILSNSVQLAGHVVLGDWVWIAGVSAVHQFVTIGQHSYIAGGSLVSKDVPPYIKAVRNPLSYGGVNSVGLKRRGFDLEKINHILDIYRYIFNKGMNTTQALEFIEEELPATDERDEIVTFIRDSGRGIIKRFGKGLVEED